MLVKQPLTVATVAQTNVTDSEKETNNVTATQYNHVKKTETQTAVSNGKIYKVVLAQHNTVSNHEIMTPHALTAIAM